MTKVVFRKYKDDGSIIALFPEELWSKTGYDIACYQHIGQHGSADYDTVIQQSAPTTPEEHRELLNELKSISYDDLKVRIKCRPNYTKLKTIQIS